MQYRMKSHQLTTEQINRLLQECQTGSLATPQYSGHWLPDNMVKGTAVVVINVTELTGNYWK